MLVVRHDFADGVGRALRIRSRTGRLPGLERTASNGESKEEGDDSFIPRGTASKCRRDGEFRNGRVGCQSAASNSFAMTTGTDSVL